jgi:hypothetical protein
MASLKTINELRSVASESELSSPLNTTAFDTQSHATAGNHTLQLGVVIVTT